jgi:hypothetical protein
MLDCSPKYSVLLFRSRGGTFYDPNRSRRAGQCGSLCRLAVLLAVLIERLLVLVADKTGGAAMFGFSRIGWFGFFGVIWLISFGITWRFFFPFQR